MDNRSFASHATACLLALGSFVLALLLLADLGFMVAYSATGGGGSGWWGPAWRKLILNVVQPGPMALFGGWVALIAGMSLPGYLRALPDQRARAGISLASMASLLSNCGLMGAGIAVPILACLATCRLIYLW